MLIYEVRFWKGGSCKNVKERKGTHYGLLRCSHVWAWMTSTAYLNFAFPSFLLTRIFSYLLVLATQSHRLLNALYYYTKLCSQQKQSHQPFWRFHLFATVTASFIACPLSSILHVNCVYTVIIDATFNLWSICKLEEAPGIEGFVMVLIMTNYFHCKLCIHTHTPAHTHIHKTHIDDAKPGPSWLCTEVSVATHSLTSTISAALPRTGLTAVCVLCSHQWGFSCTFTINTYFWCWCSHCSFPSPQIYMETMCVVLHISLWSCEKQ